MFHRRALLTTVPHKAAPAYIGPGDVVTGAVWYVGFQPYSTAVALAHAPVADGLDTVSAPVTINFNNNGSITTPGDSSGNPAYPNISKLYDQIGTRHLNVVHSGPIQLFMSGGAYASLYFNGGGFTSTLNALAVSLPWTVVLVARAIAAPESCLFTTSGAVSPSIGANIGGSAPNTWSANNATATASDSVAHIGQVIFQDATHLLLKIDNAAPVTVNPGGNVSIDAANPIAVGCNLAGGHASFGVISAIGIWPVDMTNVGGVDQTIPLYNRLKSNWGL